MRAFLTLVLLAGMLPAQAQLDNSGLEQELLPGLSATAEDSLEKSLSLGLFSYHYFRNYEYFNDFADGLTYYGLQLSPVLTYRANPHLSIYGGVFLAKDFGNEDFRMVEPVLGIRYEKNGIRFSSGAIEPHLSHGYIEPLMDYDRSITQPLEYGTQLKFDRFRHTTDIWVSWRNMIYKPSDEQEEILGGITSAVHLLKKDAHRLSIPLQVLGWHQGGQIDTLSLPAVTRVNAAAGVEYAWEREAFIEKILLRNYVLGFFNSQDLPYKRGTAFYLNAGVESRWLDLMLSYWQADRFAAPAGAPIFQSVSSHIDHAGMLRDERRLLFLRLKKDFHLAQDLFLSARLEPFWDLDDSYSDYSMSLFLVYRGGFLLKAF